MSTPATMPDNTRMIAALLELAKRAPLYGSYRGRPGAKILFACVVLKPNTGEQK